MANEVSDTFGGIRDSYFAGDTARAVEQTAKAAGETLLAVVQAAKQAPGMVTRVKGTSVA